MSSLGSESFLLDFNFQVTDITHCKCGIANVTLVIQFLSIECSSASGILIARDTIQLGHLIVLPVQSNCSCKLSTGQCPAWFLLNVESLTLPKINVLRCFNTSMSDFVLPSMLNGTIRWIYAGECMRCCRILGCSWTFILRSRTKVHSSSVDVTSHMANKTAFSFSQLSHCSHCFTWTEENLLNFPGIREKSGEVEETLFQVT